MNPLFFDTLCISPKDGAAAVKRRAETKKINLRYFDDGNVSMFLYLFYDVLLAFGIVFLMLFGWFIQNMRLSKVVKV